MTDSEPYFTAEERVAAIEMTRELLKLCANHVSRSDINKVDHIIRSAVADGHMKRDRYGFNPVTRHLNTALLLAQNIGPDRNIVIATLLYNLSRADYVANKTIVDNFGPDIAHLVAGLLKISTLYRRSAAVESENFHRLLLTLAEDIRVIIIMIVDRLALMRVINHHPDEKFVADISSESRYLYAPLAHRLGLYAIKSELEDLSLKYTNREMYTSIARKLNEKKREREKYIADFIAPVKEALERAGLSFHIKGRTKSINSIWNKMQKQGKDVNEIYDLFAIRVIIDAPEELEKAQCWHAYSIVTAMYTANTARLRDWLTIPKSNGYESLHITVLGPGDRWVEVQIRSQRMDEVAERGLAAHWKYKGIKSEGGLDEWMNNVRDLLESGNSASELQRNASLRIYDNEVFVFTPKGDLFKLPAGATLLDFAFHIHSKLGCTCIGGKVDGKNRKITYKLRSGDTIEILTSSTQTPKADWLNIAVTSKARNKIKQQIKEMESRQADLGREMLQRRMKNRKIDTDESTLMKAIKRLGYKTATQFYCDVANETINVNNVIQTYENILSRESEITAHQTAENFTLLQKPGDNQPGSQTDTLIIGENLKGVNYKLARCCNPIFGDNVVGFIASEGAIKIHRADCPNAIHLLQRYPYRRIPVAWTGKLGGQFAVNLRIIGNDDISIVTNITSLINKEANASLRSISIESNDGLFQGFLVITVTDKNSLNSLINKIRNVKGVKDVTRNS